jgi:ABC-type transporter Mla subunit MlaD
MIDHDRLTERVSPAMLTLELKRAARPLLVLAIGFAAAAATGAYILSHLSGGVGSTHTMKFAVADATGVVPGRAEVRFKGIAAGTIESTDLVGGHAVLTVTVADKFGKMYRNAQAELRPNSALQDMYLDIVSRGTPSTGVPRSGYVVPLDQTHSPVNLAGVLNLFQPGVRAHMHDLINQLGNGLADRGADLRQAFINLAPLLKIAGNVAQQLAARALLTRHLVHNTGSLSATLAARSAQLHALITSGTTTLQALSTAGGTALRETIHELPPTLTDLQSALSAFDGLVPHLNGAIDNLMPVADHLPAGLHRLKTLAVSADPAVRKLQAPIVKLEPLANQLRPFSSHLAGALTKISPQVPAVDKLTTYWSECTKQIAYFWFWDQSMSKFFDAQGQMVRGNPQFGFYTLPTVKPGYSLVNPEPCAGGSTIGGIPTPKYPGPSPAP